MVVRRAEAREIEAAIAVWPAANPESPLRQHPERLRRWAADPGADVFVAVEGDRVVGMVLSLLGRADDGAGEPIPGLRHLTGLAVVEDRRRTGVASSLLRMAVDEAVGEGYTRMTLWVHAHNLPARRLFEAHGFRPTSRTALDDAGVETVHVERAL